MPATGMPGSFEADGVSGSCTHAKLRATEFDYLEQRAGDAALFVLPHRQLPAVASVLYRDCCGSDVTLLCEEHLDEL